MSLGRRSWMLAVVVVALLFAAACGDSDDGSASVAADEAAGGAGQITMSVGPAQDEAVTTTEGEGATSGSVSGEATSLRLGYFANVTHAPALIGEANGIFADALGSEVDIEYSYFNAGTEAIEALFSGAIDATFIGPNPAINGFAQSSGEALRIVAGTTSGGASLVVSEEITSVDDLAGTTLATPSLGNTQDVALRAWLAEQGYETDTTGGGDVSIRPQGNADTLTTFQQGAIDGAWVPEPWATRLVLEGGGKVLVDERDVWPDGQFVTTHLIVATEYLEANPQNVRHLIEALLDAIEVANGDAATAQAVTNDSIERITTSRLADETISGAWDNLTFTPDPVASSLARSKDDAVAAGLLEDVDLTGIYDLTVLEGLLVERGQAEVSGS